MNSWEQRERADFYMDRSRNTRFTFYQYAVAFREVQMWYFDKYKKDELGIRDNLYTLLNYVSPTITTIGTPNLAQNLTINHIDYPANYHYFVSLTNSIDGVPIETRPLQYNQLSNTLIDSFRKPDNKRCYHLEDSTGWRIYRGYGGTLTNELAYLISPSDWSIGTESDLIDEGTGVLTIGVNYTATSEVVESGINYQAGQQFNAASTNLTSGQVIPTSVLVDSNLPDTVAEEIARLAASFLQLGASAFEKANATMQIAEDDGK